MVVFQQREEHRPVLVKWENISGLTGEETENSNTPRTATLSILSASFVQFLSSPAWLRSSSFQIFADGGCRKHLKQCTVTKASQS